MEIGKLPDLSKYRDFLFPGIVIILIVVSLVIVVKPKITELMEIRGNLAKQKQELAQLIQKAAILEGYDQNELQVRANKTLKVLPAEKNGPLVLATVRTLVNEQDLDLEGLSVNIGEVSTGAAKPKSSKEKVPSLEIKLSISGNLDDFYKFLEGIQTTAPIMKIKQLSFSREGNSVSGSLLLASYYLNLPVDIGKTSSKIVPITSQEAEIYQQLSGYQLAISGNALPPIGSGKEDPFVY